MNEQLKTVGPMIILFLNLGHSIFAIGMSIFGIAFFFALEPIIGLILGLALLLVSVLLLRTQKKAGWLYALLLNLVLIPLYLFLPGLLWVYGVTFAVLVIIFMLVPVFREPFK